MMKTTFIAISIAFMLAGCQVPIDTHGQRTQVAARCRLMAADEDRPHFAFGLIGMAIVASNANTRRQEIYDACVEAQGERESPPETMLLPPSAAQRGM